MSQQFGFQLELDRRQPEVELDGGLVRPLELLANRHSQIFAGIPWIVVVAEQPVVVVVGPL